VWHRNSALLRGSKSRWSGFTLIELTFVLLIIGILAGLAVMGLRQPTDAAKLTAAGEQVHALDRAARRLAKKSPSGTVTIHINMTTNQLTLRPSRQEFDLQGDVLVKRIELGERQFLRGNIEIPFSSNGQSENYRVQLSRSETLRSFQVFGRSGLFSQVDQRGEP
jgi:prepilin-type N-terminal cleavage/methylation domain-containing protein